MIEFKNNEPAPAEDRAGELLLNSPILVIDDEELVTQMIGHQLRTAGFKNVTTLNDSMSVMDHISTQTPDLILTDLQMPDVSGKYLLQVINKDVNLANIPIIVISADDDSHSDTLNLGATFFISKPVEPQELIECVYECLNTKRLLDELEYSANRERANLRRARMDSCKQAESLLRGEVRGDNA